MSSFVLEQFQLNPENEKNHIFGPFLTLLGHFPQDENFPENSSCDTFGLLWTSNFTQNI